MSVARAGGGAPAGRLRVRPQSSARRSGRAAQNRVGCLGPIDGQRHASVGGRGQGVDVCSGVRQRQRPHDGSRHQQRHVAAGRADEDGHVGVDGDRGARDRIADPDPDPVQAVGAGADRRGDGGRHRHPVAVGVQRRSQHQPGVRALAAVRHERAAFQDRQRRAEGAQPRATGRRVGAVAAAEVDLLGLARVRAAFRTRRAEAAVGGAAAGRVTAVDGSVAVVVQPVEASRGAELALTEPGRGRRRVERATAVGSRDVIGGTGVRAALKAGAGVGPRAGGAAARHRGGSGAAEEHEGRHRDRADAPDHDCWIPLWHSERHPSGDHSPTVPIGPAKPIFHALPSVPA